MMSKPTRTTRQSLSLEILERKRAGRVPNEQNAEYRKFMGELIEEARARVSRYEQPPSDSGSHGLKNLAATFTASIAIPRRPS